MGNPFTRPTAAKAAAAEQAKKLTEEELVPIKIMVHPETRDAIRAAAALRRTDMRRLLLGLCKEAGIEVHPTDALPEDRRKRKGGAP
jgi:hypothetical protein